MNTNEHENEGLQIVDCRSSIANQRDRGRPARFFTVAGTSCPSPSPVGRRGLAAPILSEIFTATSFAEATEGQEAAKVAKERGEDGIADRRFWIKGIVGGPLLHRSWDILSQPVLGASCSKSKAANEPASSSNPPHFDVQCWMFNVRCSFSLSPTYLNLQSSNAFSLPPLC